jgi:hypothetical protein
MPVLSALACLFILTGTLGLRAQDLSSNSREAHHSAGSVVTPFHLTAQELSYAADSAVQPHRTTYVVARRSDGSNSISFSVESPKGEKGFVTEIFDHSSLKYKSIEPFTHSVTTDNHTAAEMASELTDKHGCSPEELAIVTASTSSATMLGYTVFPIAESNGDMKWVAPALGCYPLKQTEEMSPRGSRNEITVTSVEEGEPDPDLFAVPANYVERSPSEVDALYNVECGEHLYSDLGSHLDQFYYAHQAR